MFAKFKDKSAVGLKSVLNNIKKYLPVAVFGVALCFLINAVYGEDMMCIAVVCIITVKNLFDTTLNIRSYLWQFLLLLLIITVGIFAGMNFIALTIVNALFVGVMSFVLCDNFKIGGLPFTLCLQLLIMEYARTMELYRVPFAFLCTLLCFILSIAFLTVYYEICINVLKKNKNNPYILNGCKAIANKLRMFLDKENVKKDRDLYLITKDFCSCYQNTMINQGYLLDEKQKKQFLALMTLQQISDLIYHTKSKFPEINENDRKYFEELFRIFTTVKSLKRLAVELNGFVDDFSLSNSTISSQWRKYLLSFADYLKYGSRRPAIKSSFKKAVEFKLSILKKRLSLSGSFSLRKSVQTAAAVGLCTLIAQFLPITDAMILPVVALTVFTVYPEAKIRCTLWGVACMIATCLLYMVIFSAVPFGWRVALTFVVMVTAVVSVENPFMKSISACLILSSVIFPTAVIGGEVLIKSAVMLAGCCISWLVAKFLLPTKRHQIYKYHIIDLAQTDWSIMQLLENSCFDSTANTYLCEMLFLQHLMVDHINSTPFENTRGNDNRFESMISFNCDILSEIAYAVTILKPVTLPNSWIIEMKKRLTIV